MHTVYQTSTPGTVVAVTYVSIVKMTLYCIMLISGRLRYEVAASIGPLAVVVACQGFLFALSMHVHTVKNMPPRKRKASEALLAGHFAKYLEDKDRVSYLDMAHDFGCHPSEAWRYLKTNGWSEINDDWPYMEKPHGTKSLPGQDMGAV